MPERRRKARVDIKFELHYGTAQEFLAAYSRNISGGGIYIQTRKPLDLTDMALIRFTLPGTDHRIETRGAVVWINFPSPRPPFPPGMGMKFLDLDPKGRRVITEFVKKVSRPSLPSPRKPSGKPGRRQEKRRSRSVGTR